MIDPSYAKLLLELIGAAKYEGLETNHLVDSLSERSSDDGDFYRFKYHMDEMWDAGLIKGRDGPGKNGWGYQGTGNRIFLIPVPLVLTPLGSQVLEELNKPRGIDVFKQAIRSAGEVAGSEALKQGIASLFGS